MIQVLLNKWLKKTWIFKTIQLTGISMFIIIIIIIIII